MARKMNKIDGKTDAANVAYDLSDNAMIYPISGQKDLLLRILL